MRRGLLAQTREAARNSVEAATVHGRLVVEIWWALQGLNLRLIPCEGITLPLS